MLKHLLPLATLLACLPIAKPAFAEVILQEYCRQGSLSQGKPIEKLDLDVGTVPPCQPGVT